MFKIGEFSKFSRVSVKMLRHYDEIGLLRPAHVDASTGYRYYLAEQLPRLNQIIALKDLGFGLDQIARLLDEPLSGQELGGILKLKRSEILARIDEEQRRLARVEMSLRHIAQRDRLPDHMIILREIPAQWVASIRLTVSDMDGISALFNEVEAFAARHAARAISPPLMRYHDSEFYEDHSDVEVAVPLSEPIESDARIRVYQLEALSEAACMVYTGDYANGDLLLAEFPRWLAANDYEAAGPLREVYLRFGADNLGYTLPEAYLTTQAEALVTELQLPVHKRSAEEK